MFASFRLAAKSRAARTIAGAVVRPRCAGAGAGAVVGCLTVLLAPAGASTASTKATTRTGAASAPELTQAQAEAAPIAQESYLYLYPLISMDLTRRIVTGTEGGS